MKQLLRLLIFMCTSPAVAQDYGNEWINYSQQYYAFKIWQTGIHRIDQSALVAGNVPVGSFTSENIQLFGREQEIPILVVDGNDNSLDPGDYILFYAQRNDGWLDSALYMDPEWIANPGYSLYNDTIHYFLTWNNQTNNKRFMVDTDTDFTGYTPANFVLREAFSTVGGDYIEGYREGDAAGSTYAPGEGWGFPQAVATTSNAIQVWPIATPNLYTGGDAPVPSFHFRSTSNSIAASTGNFNHHLRVEIGSSNYLVMDTIFNNYQFITAEKEIPANLLNSGVTNLHYGVIADQGAVVDRQNLTYYRLRYASYPHANNQVFDRFRTVYNTGNPKTLIDLQGFSETPLVFTLGGAPKLLTAVANGANWQFLVPNNTDGNPNDVIVGSVAGSIAVTNIEAVNGNGQFTDFSALSTEGAFLMVYPSVLQSAVAEYANYRASISGGAHNVLLADIEELCQQYGGGIPKHIMGIRRFALHAYDLSTNRPQALFLVGKGISERAGARHLPLSYARSLVPSFGDPASDIAITAGLHTTDWDPLIPTGRISVNDTTQLLDYLEKVIEYESVQGPNSPVNSDWQKQILHFAGGSTAEQQETFQSYVNQMKDVIEDSIYAGHVTSYFKTSSDPLDPTVVASVTDRISQGVSIMNFFGHSAVSNNGFEINIDEPSNWENTGKYPVVIGNSCHNGNIFSNGELTSERFVNIPNEGAIAFISSVSVGYDVPLSHYTINLYRQFGYHSYGQPIGLQMKRTIQQIQPLNPSYTNATMESTCTQMTLHGDPMLKINWHTNPEIEITQEGVYFTPEDLNLTVDSIDMHIILTNLGSSVMDTFHMEIRRNFPGTSTDSVYLIEVPKLHYKDTILFRFPMQPNIGIGENQFSITVDIPSSVPEEHDELGNNQINKSLYIRVDGILPVYPYDFAVVPIDSVTVKASTIDPIAPVRTYHFELDTVHYYNSPQLRRFSITAPGGVKEVHPSQWLDANGNPFPLVCTDSTVYFWRVAVDSSELTWNEFSFQYIPGKQGWGQDHFFQFKKNSFYNIIYDTTERLRAFAPAEPRDVEVNCYNNSSYYSAWYLENSLLEYGLCFTDPSIYVGVLDPLTLEPWGTRYETENPDHGFGNLNDLYDGCRDRSENYFIFRQENPAQMAAFQNMIENEIPDSHYVVIYTPITTLYSVWDAIAPSVYTTFQNVIGSTLVNNTQPEGSFALFFQKGDPTSVVERHYPDYVTDSEGNNVSITASVLSVNYAGIEKTPMIGPSAQWETIYWKRDSLEAVQNDSVRLWIEAYDVNGSQQLVIDTLFTPNDSIINVNNFLPASSYPYMRLGVYYHDDDAFTPAQVDRLHVLFQPIPEAAIDGTLGYYISPLSADSLSEGEEVSFAVDIRNISAWNMDSLLVNYWVEDVNRVKHPIPYARQDSLLAGETFRDTVEFSTVNLAGLNSLWVEVNPYVNGSTVITDQPEQFHFNNLLQLPFFVQGDDVHPILDVTFNGIHILNNDIVNPESEIVITLKDDNPLLLMNEDADTSLFGIYLTDPNGVQKRIPFMDGNGNVVMQWIPAEAQNKKFRIIYPGMFELDGVYTLLVQGTDKSGNVSGDLEYRISFEVIHESTITYMMNYPNPFSTSTRFVFTLTGSEEPDDMIIQIMTVSGRVIREITEAEIGPIHIGRNISEYAWDGTDEFGDPVANGVYLYRVKVKINGEDIKHRESGADAHFKKGFGKMYLMR